MKYSNQTRILVAVDCIIFGFDGTDYKLLLIQRGFAPEKEKWSLMGGFLAPDESLDEAAIRILNQLTGLHDVYMEQMQVFSKPDRDPVERTIAVAYVALIDIQKYMQQLNDSFHAKWFTIQNLPKMIFDHEEMVEMAKTRLRYKAAMHPILFELLPDKFTLPHLQAMYESLYDTKIDKRNFTRKVLSTNLLIKEDEKDKTNSKKGAFFYRLDKDKYEEEFQNVQNFIPRIEIPSSSE
ncbi:DNA mistmatch repair protein MutT [Rhodonellum psychrophilum GCM71 = DSM 17998]|uniref:DNA mistmatch repair protein MutT n=2 Tax=Rhodonellum TaxID=336827 RepID=U5BSI2_9BACT|nr:MULTISPECIES: NUDIX domain-containing protein [Rhodonellum]ERM83565.1 DNA mistmatch repair protein MutT [Rhodonellum psychrophilum GCM71 = DSM 17998]SDY53217.1 ADP-ribose pyrophosphatase YjhB, NUDIX family [Rhodonellum ikkaensis]